MKKGETSLTRPCCGNSVVCKRCAVGMHAKGQPPLKGSSGSVSRAKDCLAPHIDWSRACFADEKIWQCDGPARRPKQWYDIRDPPPQLLRRGAQSGGLAIWGAFSRSRVPDIQVVSTHVSAREYCNVLGHALLPCMSHQRHTLYHDRQTGHTAKRS